MPRRKLIRQTEFPYHVVTRSNNKAWFQIPNYEVWDICKEAIIYAQGKRPVDLHCFILMSNHYHLLISTPNADIDEFMRFFNLQLSKLISKKSGVINQKFSNRYKWTIVQTQNYLLNVYRYIYQNPVRANITNDCFSYPYSSLHFSRFEAKLLNYRPHIVYKNEKIWIEKKYGHDFDTIVRNSLKKETFKVSSRTNSYFSSLLNNPREIEIGK